MPKALHQITLVLAATLVSLTALALDAERTTVVRSDPAYVRGVFVTPVAGLPLSAIVQEEMTRGLADGTTFRRRDTVVIARDSKGRIHNEGHAASSTRQPDDPTLLRVHLFDPETRVNIFMNAATHIARRAVLVVPPATVPPGNWAQHESVASECSCNNRAEFMESKPNIQYLDLGTNVYQGYAVHGYRRTVTVSEQFSGTGKPVDVVDEYWYADELKLDLVLRHNDPRSAFVTIAVQNLTIGEPPANLFEVPADYHVIDIPQRNPAPPAEAPLIEMEHSTTTAAPATTN